MIKKRKKCVPFCCIPQKASSPPGPELQFGPVEETKLGQQMKHKEADEEERPGGGTCSLMWICDRRWSLVACSGTSVGIRNTELTHS